MQKEKRKHNNSVQSCAMKSEESAGLAAFASREELKSDQLERKTADSWCG